MHVSRTLFLAAAAFAVLLAPGVASAQSSTEAFERMTSALKPGDRLIVTGQDGRESKGQVVVATPASLTLLVPDGAIEQRRSFDRAGIATIRRTDSMWNGILIGAGVGMVATEVWARQTCGNDSECAAITRLAGWGALAGGGAAVGALIDRLKGNDVIYRAGAMPPTVRLAPFAGPRGTGVSVAVTF